MNTKFWPNFILRVLFLCMSSGVVFRGNVIVNTPDGLVKGQLIRSNVSEYYSFTSIPFAEPPIRELRFMPPRPPRRWQGILLATQKPPACPQPVQESYTLVMDEDCLYLNVYTPAMIENRPEKGWPVILWVYGGGFQSGWSYDYGPEHLIKYDVAVITINHRLGALGFLNLEVPSASGNAGLRDIVAALQWVQRSAKAFGIDPQQLTLAGQSSGAIAVSALILSPSAQGLFQRVIMQSGSILGYRFFDTENHKSHAFRLQKLLGIDIEDPEELVKEFKKIPAMDVVKASTIEPEGFKKGFAQFTPFVATLDKSNGEHYEAFLPGHPLELTKAGNYTKVPQLVGFNSHEGLRVMGDLKNNMDLLNEINANDDILVPTDLFPQNVISEAKKQAKDKIREYYFGKESISVETLDSYIKLGTELWYVHPIDYSLRLQEYAGNDKPVYYYEFSVNGDFNLSKLKLNIMNMTGTNHGDEVGYIWSTPTTDQVIADDKSINAREIMLTLWTSFIKTGNPTSSTAAIIPIQWKPVAYPVMNYMQIDFDLTMHLKSPRVNETNFWKEIYGYDLI